jgi:hypothetical protein
MNHSADMPPPEAAGTSGAGDLDLSGIRLEHDAFGRLVLIQPDGRRFEGLVPVRCYPFSAPGQWVSLCDEHGHEVACLPDLSRLPDEARRVLDEEIAQREFIPVIQQIESIVPENEPSTWSVITDRGPTRFLLHTEDHIRRLGPGALIMDVNGIRFHLPDLNRLDPKSKKLLGRYLS